MVSAEGTRAAFDMERRRRSVVDGGLITAETTIAFRPHD
jgi:hypothetical protein